MGGRADTTQTNAYGESTHPFLGASDVIGTGLNTAAQLTTVPVPRSGGSSRRTQVAAGHNRLRQGGAASVLDEDQKMQAHVASPGNNMLRGIDASTFQRQPTETDSLLTRSQTTSTTGTFSQQNTAPIARRISPRPIEIPSRITTGQHSPSASLSASPTDRRAVTPVHHNQRPARMMGGPNQHILDGLPKLSPRSNRTGRQNQTNSTQPAHQPALERPRALSLTGANSRPSLVSRSGGAPIALPASPVKQFKARQQQRDPQLALLDQARGLKDENLFGIVKKGKRGRTNSAEFEFSSQKMAIQNGQKGITKLEANRQLEENIENGRRLISCPNETSLPEPHSVAAVSMVPVGMIILAILALVYFVIRRLRSRAPAKKTRIRVTASRSCTCPCRRPLVKPRAIVPLHHVVVMRTIQPNQKEDVTVLRPTARKCYTTYM